LVYVLRDLGQPEEAEAVCREAVELQERLAGDVHAVLNDTIDLGCSYCTLANLLRARQPQAALEWYTKAVARLGPVVEAEPRLATARQYLRTGHLGRAETLAQLGRHAEAVRAWDRTIELDDGGNRDWLRFRRANDLARAGDVVRALAEVDQLTGAAGASAEALYDGACVLATVAAQSTPDADGHAARAVRLLRGAIVRGFADVTQMLNDTDLDPLRTRPDYVDLLWDLADQPPIWR
jgi:tetratricopeptide (TPR) repeat protein